MSEKEQEKKDHRTVNIIQTGSAGRNSIFFHFHKDASANSKLPIKAVTFDLWLTLVWDSEDLEEYRKLRRLVSFHRFAKKQGNGLENEKLSFNRIRLAMEELSVRVKALYEQGYDVHPNERGKMLFDILEIKVPKNEAEEVYQKAGSVLSNSGYVRRFPNANPEAKPTLRVLKETYPGLQIALISNAARSAMTYRRMLKSFGILEYFDSLIISCEVGYLKPRKEIFEAALKSLNVNPKETLHIGDLFKADVVGATGCGMNSCLYTGLWHKYAQYMNPGEHIPKDFKPKERLVVEEIEKLREAVEVSQRVK